MVWPSIEAANFLWSELSSSLANNIVIFQSISSISECHGQYLHVVHLHLYYAPPTFDHLPRRHPPLLQLYLYDDSFWTTWILNLRGVSSLIFYGHVHDGNFFVYVFVLGPGQYP